MQSTAETAIEVDLGMTSQFCKYLGDVEIGYLASVKKDEYSSLTFEASNGFGIASSDES
jgi:hypothetical protein